MLIRYLVLLAVVAFSSGQQAYAQARWTPERAAAWHKARGWLAGSNFIPSTAINQLEMWQADTFDEATIDRELAMAEGLGFNSMRVFLHDLPWKQDSAGFVQRIDRFLGIADRHHIGVMLVLLDGVWDPHPAAGPQRPPKPHVHNSGWVQSPGAEILGNPQRHVSSLESTLGTSPGRETPGSFSSQATQYCKIYVSIAYLAYVDTARY